MHLSKEKTFVMIKPDGIQRGLIGEILKRIERTGLKLVGIKMVVPSEDMVKKHYTIDPEWVEKAGKKSIETYLSNGREVQDDPIKQGEMILERLIKYITSGPVIAMAFQGVHAVSVVRKVVGSTEPLSSDVGTIRGDLVLDSYELSDLDKRSVRNLIHASGEVEEAEKEISLWFKDEEIIDYRLINEEILYDVNLDGILE